MKRALQIAWWALVAVTTVLVVANIIHSHTTDDPRLANEAATALQVTGLESGIQAVGATSDGRVFVTLGNSAPSDGSSAQGIQAERRVAKAVFGALPQVTAVVLLDANHGVVSSSNRRP